MEVNDTFTKLSSLCLWVLETESQFGGLNMVKSKSAGLFLFVLFFLQTMTACSGTENQTLDCFQGEKEALLKFKGSLISSFRQLSSWDGSDCCKWYGVVCDEATNNVVKLDLRHDYKKFLASSSGNMSDQHIVSQEINSCLLDLNHLEYLDLSGNDFLGSSIPEFLGSMKQLRYLNLSGAGLSGTVPQQLGNLSSLQVLDLSRGEALMVGDLAWLTRLSSLQHLDLSYVDLSQVRNIVKTLGMIPSLLELRMSHSGLDNTHLSLDYSNSTLPSALQRLDLSGNSFEGNVPYSLHQNFTSLRILDLSENSFNSSVPLIFMHQKSLVQLNLAWNRFSHFEGGLSMILLTLCHMRSLDLTGNGLEEEIFGPETGNFSAACVASDLQVLNLGSNKIRGNLKGVFHKRLTNLEHLDLSFNSFSDTIPLSLGTFSALKELDLSNNQLTGPIPASVGRLMALREMSLAYNQLNGTIPSSLGHLSKLAVLDLSSNSFEGMVSEAHFDGLNMLKYLHMDYNTMLTFKTQPGWIPPFQLENILLASCKIGPLFPSWLQTQHSVERLVLSNASISGTLPIWLHSMHLSELDLSHNHITGPISNLPISLKTVDLSSNLVSGPLHPDISINMMPNLESLLLRDNLLNDSIPKTLCKISRELQVLDLSRNRLHGKVPDCWEDLVELRVVKLSSNRLTGLIPSSFGHLSSLQWLHLNRNGFHGELPLALRNCTSLMVLDVGENELSGNIPKWVGENLTELKVLRLHKNRFSGRIPSELCQLCGLQILDLSGNKLIGRIHQCFVNFSGMIMQEDTSKFAVAYDTQWVDENMMQIMKGVELEYSKTLVFVINMDLSSNNLVGEIPEELTALSGLIGLNLSHNHLRGGIPKRIGDMKSLISLDFSSNNLSGVIPTSLASLTSLSNLNLSYNNLSGRIPTGNQLQTLTNPSIYVGNNRLCGAPVTKKCLGGESSQVPSKRIHEEEDDDDDNNDSGKVWFYLDIMSGFATGFWGVIGVLYFRKSWRQAFFRFLEVMKDRMLMKIVVTLGVITSTSFFIDKVCTTFSLEGLT